MRVGDSKGAEDRAADWHFDISISPEWSQRIFSQREVATAWPRQIREHLLGLRSLTMNRRRFHTRSGRRKDNHFGFVSVEDGFE